MLTVKHNLAPEVTMINLKIFLNVSALKNNLDQKAVREPFQIEWHLNPLLKTSLTFM